MIYHGDWSSLEGLIEDFYIATDSDNQAPYPADMGVEILYAYYKYEDYSGTAFVLFKKGGKFYEVNGSHCSCFGLEGQWRPEEVDLQVLKLRIETEINGSWCDDETRLLDEEILKAIEKASDRPRSGFGAFVRTLQ